ncbi:alpha/beta hydrolase [uncultured Actinomyces sp.]|uniref:alpha/beta hydrolase n=1 Tax=uncultured Actinomyces sp. TaxID=249061 RepID=UPI0028D8E2B3|nr:alpha/beta hydrolase [uncultured Actinomyces sp.]
MNSRSRLIVAVLVVLALASNFGVAYYFKGSIDSFAEAAAAVSPNNQNKVTVAHSADPLPGKPTKDQFYSQPLNWRQCEVSEITSNGVAAPRDIDKYQCASLTAPLDWENLDGNQITLALAIHRADQSEGKALFFNLGGPGGAAVSSIVSQVNSSLGNGLVGAFDIVALDPRGVGASTPVRCLSDEDRDKQAAGTGGDKDPNATPAQLIEQAKKDSADLAKGCQDLSGNLYKHVDTVNAAKDFDMVRALLGQDKFNYLGYSYGTFLGATYAGLFPTNVGHMVLDGAVDPAVQGDDLAAMQMRGFEASLRHWVEDCQAGRNCPLTGDADAGMRKMKAFFDSLENSPLKTSDADRPLTRNLAMSAVIGLLYSTETYSILTQAMTSALNSNDGSMLLFVADLLNERNKDGSYASNSMDAIVAINSLDYSPVGNADQWTKSYETLKSELLVFGEEAGFTSAGLEGWPTSHAKRQPISAEGAPPIMVVGTTHDPATPYVMSQNLAKELSSGVLVTWEGWNHTAYSKSGSKCVATAVEGYFLRNVVPTTDVQCGADS